MSFPGDAALQGMLCHSLQVGLGIAAAGAAMLDLVTQTGNIVTYKKMSETKTHRVLCVPLAKNEPSVDAVLQPETGLQITRSKRHGLKATGIRNCIDNLVEKTNANITFCVPAEVFDDYPKQAVEGALDSHKYPFEQYVILIPINV